MWNSKQIKQMIIEYLKSGIKKADNLKLGVELEHFVVQTESKKSVSYYGEDGVGQLLRELSTYFKKTEYENGNILGLSNDKYSLSLEPGSQLEISIRPMKTVLEIERIYNDFLKILNPILENKSYSLEAIGYLPKSMLSEISLIPKKRYELMDRYFSSTGTMGRSMMRATASCQVSIDYVSEEDFVRKFRCAYLLSPVLSYITSNSPVYEAERNDNLLLRTTIWRNTDNDRTGIVPGVFKPDFGFEAYADYLLSVPAVFTIKNDSYIESDKSVISEVLSTDDDQDKLIQLFFSLLFPDIRLRQYIEIRVADSMKLEVMLGYIALIKSLFSNIQRLEKLLKQIVPIWNETSIIQAQDSIISFGNAAVVYGRPIEQLVEELIDFASEGLEAIEKEYLNHLIQRSKV